MSDNRNFLSDIITPYEAEHLINSLKPIDIEEYGSKEWIRQHEHIDKLNLQAHKNAIVSTDEFVMDTLVTLDKLNVLLYDLLVSEAWKSNVLPLVKKSLSKVSTFKSYLTLYHEASVANLLEIVLYHRTACEALDEHLSELIDYCYRKLLLIAKEVERKDREPKEVANMSSEEELTYQKDNIDFSISIICLSIIRFISDNLDHLTLPVVHQLLENNDILCVLVPILEEKPWIRTNRKGDKEKFEDQKWVPIPKSDYGKITKIEAQIWLTVYNILMSQDNKRKYEITSFRKQNLLRLRKYMNEYLIDQIPILTNLLRFLEELSIMSTNPVASYNTFIVQTIPEMRTKIMKDKKWAEIAKYQIEHFFTETAESRKEDMKRVLDMYNINYLDEMMDEPKCGQCGKKATQRCSRCKHEWYCGRDCQVKAWKDHKSLCNIIASNNAAKDKADNKESGDQKQAAITEIKDNGNKVEPQKSAKIQEISQASEEKPSVDSNPSQEKRLIQDLNEID